ncbi:MAG: anion permease [Flavobacteriales bacterium]|nr:anion permease [Flavobacteriales bacterium]
MRTHLLRLSGPVLGLVVYALLRYLGHAPAAMAGVVTWMAVWWISEAVPLAVTSLLPLVLFPLLGIDTMGGTATNYGKEIIFLFLGGFLLALALERAQLHRRIALRIIGRIRGTGPRLIAGMMVTSALLSMWMNSTSCVLVMLPIALSLLDGDGDPALRKRLTVPLLLAVSYGATIGGMATPVGTPPNLVLLEVWRDRWPDRPPIGFGQWMSFGIPLAVIYLGDRLAAHHQMGLQGPEGSHQSAGRSESTVGLFGKSDLCRAGGRHRVRYRGCAVGHGG